MTTWQPTQETAAGKECQADGELWIRTAVLYTFLFLVGILWLFRHSAGPRRLPAGGAGVEPSRRSAVAARPSAPHDADKAHFLSFLLDGEYREPMRRTGGQPNTAALVTSAESGLYDDMQGPDAAVGGHDEAGCTNAIPPAESAAAYPAAPGASAHAATDLRGEVDPCPHGGTAEADGPQNERVPNEPAAQASDSQLQRRGNASAELGNNDGHGNPERSPSSTRSLIVVDPARPSQLETHEAAGDPAERDSGQREAPLGSTATVSADACSSEDPVAATLSSDAAPRERPEGESELSDDDPFFTGQDEENDFSGRRYNKIYRRIPQTSFSVLAAAAPGDEKATDAAPNQNAPQTADSQVEYRGDTEAKFSLSDGDALEAGSAGRTDETIPQEGSAPSPTEDGTVHEAGALEVSQVGHAAGTVHGKEDAEQGYFEDAAAADDVESERLVVN
ncbi:hypothetical protein BESB_082630 [Besnoitia besnoiti]|uniref:Transmembrane protein n=1 Tax=Besnoitia besnoiti TaxID=94643 RepID=A0A2A9M7A4_BESBE|nr:hypothetical protein BESB_082630 [Besnoitia besnoiti]PFH33064.1 hypothetical protein BESB_082630 [Besnoitia besnoiti]